MKHVSADQHLSPTDDGAQPRCEPAGDSLYGLRIESIVTATDVLIDVPECPVCQCQRARPRFSVEQFESRVVECVECGLGRLHPLPTADELMALYPLAYYGTAGSKFRGLVEIMVRIVGARQSRFLARHIPPGGRALDVGCGRAVALSALHARRIEPHGFDVVPHAVEGLDPRIHVRVAPSLVEANYPSGFFDGVIVWHVLEHVPDPGVLLREVHRIMKPNGVLIVAVPNFSSLQARWAGADWFHLDLPRHLFHFPLAALTRLVTDCGFTCDAGHHFSLRQNPFGWVQSALNRIPWLPRCGLYELLHRHSARDRLPFTPAIRFQLRLAYWLLMPLGLLLSIVAAAARSGATAHIVARRK